ncbi:helix-turn-helix domain-containing protein [Haladaptatus sp. T7]|uniref:winged helix-turn-helix domain-containing protein n=1 Tax=Haladaptatus sp. T7 TaxID=2029368 RepID=UPI00222E1280|nr:helix-turn-helix domain-containing protein [Haladaptatus sp. T7]
MSQSSMAAVGTQVRQGYATDSTVVTDATEVQAILDTINDADCRAILDVTGEDVLSTKEISELCDIPLSTTYRKLDCLTDVGLLEETISIRRTGKHTSEYYTRVSDVMMSVNATDGLSVTISYSAPPN